MRRRSSLLALTAVLAVLGFLGAVQFRSRAADDGLNGLSVQELGELVANLTTRNDQLRDEIRSLERQRDLLATSVERGDTSVLQVRADLNRVLGWSGAFGVTGPGVRVTVEGPLPGDAIERILNELRNAGAEALAIGSTRVVPGIVASGPAGSVTVGGVGLPEPVDILAVGQPEAMSGSLTRAGGPIALLAAQYPEVVVTVNVADRLDLPATDRDLSPRLARPRL
jgi:uncharacterized protein YlxW (UPF0749 family)